MQGLKEFISTERKVKYINQLLQVGFDTIDFGSFVSPKAIPQMRDTAEVLSQLSWKSSKTKLLAIVANTRGAEEASKHKGVTYLGYPLSISETFQQRNTNKSIVEALNQLSEIQSICKSANKELVCYISMGFGNPYGDPYDEMVVGKFIEILATLGVHIISLADTVGAADEQSISRLFLRLSKEFDNLELGVHLHSNPKHSLPKIQAAYEAGCRRFDGALKGYGGCPMANDELVGNIATETILSFLSDKEGAPEVDRSAFHKSLALADELFPKIAY